MICYGLPYFLWQSGMGVYLSQSRIAVVINKCHRYFESTYDFFSFIQQAYNYYVLFIRLKIWR